MQDYETFLTVYSTHQKIHAGQRQFQQHQEEVSGTRQRRRPGSSSPRP